MSILNANTLPASAASNVAEKFHVLAAPCVSGCPLLQFRPDMLPRIVSTTPGAKLESGYTPATFTMTVAGTVFATVPATDDSSSSSSAAAATHGSKAGIEMNRFY